MKDKLFKKFKTRWERVRAFQESEVRNLSIAQKFQQLSSLVGLAIGLEMDFIKERPKMKNSLGLKFFLEPISALEKVMKKSKRRWMIIGGVAASLLGKPRFTADIDALAVIGEEEISSVLKLANKMGFTPRIKKAAEFAKRNRVLLLKYKKSNVNLDLSLVTLPFEENAIKKSKLLRIGGVSFYLPTPEDLVIFKAVAHRPQDIIDIQEVVNSHPKIDRRYIKKMANEFAHLLEMPEIWEDIESIVIRVKRGRHPDKV